MKWWFLTLQRSRRTRRDRKRTKWAKEALRLLERCCGWCAICCWQVGSEQKITSTFFSCDLILEGAVDWKQFLSLLYLSHIWLEETPQAFFCSGSSFILLHAVIFYFCACVSSLHQVVLFAPPLGIDALELWLWAPPVKLCVMLLVSFLRLPAATWVV